MVLNPVDKDTRSNEWFLIQSTKIHGLMNGAIFYDLESPTTQISGLFLMKASDRGRNVKF